MNYGTGKQPVILLVDKTPKNNEFIKVWLKRNEYLMCEAADIFQALEEFSDYTVRQCPDVILLEIDSLSQEYVKEVFQSFCGANEVSVVELTKSSQNNGSTDSLALLRQKLDKALPRMSHAA